MKSNIKKEVVNVLLTVVASVISALGLHIFVFGNSFAPSGIDGIATMLQEITRINAGIFTFVLNLPLLIAAWFIIKRNYVIYTILFTVLASLWVYILGEMHFYQYVVESDKVIVAIFSGLLLGARTGIMLRIGASSGGIDIIACIVQNKFNRDVEKVISFVCYIIIGISYFVYHDLTCILLSVVQMFVFEKTVAFILKDTRNAVKFEIITKDPEKLKEEIIYELKHGATIVQSKGMFTDEQSTIVVTIVNTRQVPEFLQILKKYPDTFVYYTDVTGVNGNFRWRRDEKAK